MISESSVQRAARIFKEHETIIRAMVKRYACHESDADDIYQEVFLSIVQCPPSDERSLIAYLHTVIKNHVRDSARRSACRQRFIEGYTRHTGNATADDGPENQLDQAEQIQKARSLIERALPPYMGCVIFERYVRGRSVAEIASMLKVHKKSVSHYCSVALRHLRNLMNADGDEKSAQEHIHAE